MRNTYRLFIISLAISLAFSTQVYAGCLIGNFFICSLDTKGTLTASCNTAKLTNSSITASKHTYTFDSSCSGASGDEASNFYMVTQGEWNSNGIAIQTMRNKNRPSISATVKATCKYDPWIFTGSSAENPCTITDTYFSTPSSGLSSASDIASNYIAEASVKPPFCSSCDWIPQVQKQQLWNQASSLLPIPTAPVIELPAGKSVVFLATSKLSVQIRHNPNFGLAWKFEAHTKAPPNFWFVVTNPSPPLLNSKTSAGVTTGELNLSLLKDHPRIRFQVASVFPGAPWSEWREITLSELHIQPRLPQ